MAAKSRIAEAMAVALIWLSLAEPAHAYLDPSVASMIISAIVGLIATISLGFKSFYYKIRSFLRGDKDGESGADKNAPPGNEESPKG